MELLSKGGFLRMTEDKWLACADARNMLFFVDGGKRRCRLFAVACARALGHHTSDWRARQVVEAAEGFADGTINEDELLAAKEARNTRRGGPLDRFLCALAAVNFGHDGAQYCLARAAWLLVGERLWRDRERMAAAEQGVNQIATPLIREIFGNPFRPVTLAPDWLRWNDGCAVGIAKGIYADRAFDRLTILHDALLDAGCDNEDALAHCLSGGPHVRGCWLVDLILGKE